MASLDESRIESKIRSSLGVQHIRLQIEQAEADLERSHAALADLPRSVRLDLLSRQEEALEALLQREAKLVAQARQSAERELQAERVESLRIEAAPLLARAEKCLAIAREELLRVGRIDSEARANRGRVMAEPLDKAAIDFHLGKLIHDSARGTWSLSR